jgi:hypothetical protein
MTLILYVSAMYSMVSEALVVNKQIVQMGKIAKQQYPVYIFQMS